MTIMWCMVPEIWSMTDRIFCHFGAFLAILPTLKTWKIKILKKWNKLLEILSFNTSVPKIMIIRYTVPEIWCVMDVIVVFHFGLILALLHKKWKFEENEKNIWRFIILHKCAKNHDHTLYCSWDAVLQLFFFLGFFCPFTAQKIKISKKWKK